MFEKCETCDVGIQCGVMEHTEMEDFKENDIFDKTTKQNSNTEKETWFTPDSSIYVITQNDVK